MIPVQRYTNWANKPTENWLLCWFQINPWSDEWTAKNIWKTYIWTADKDVNESDPRRNGHYLSNSENKAWKNFPLFVCLTFHEKYFKITVSFPLTDSGLLYFHYKIRTASYLSARNRDSSFSFNVSTSCKFVPSESFRNATPKAVTSFWSILLLWRDHPAQKDRK